MHRTSTHEEIPMTVAVAHQAASAAKHIALREAAREAFMRGSSLAVIHIVEGLDLDVADAYRHGLDQEIQESLAEVAAHDVAWELHLGVTDDHVAEKVLELAQSAKAELLVIGARRRSPVGKFLLGSVTQTLILQAGVPVLVVKPDM
jgi:nucleotide-binding universal stress UspA family protein